MSSCLFHRLPSSEQSEESSSSSRGISTNPDDLTQRFRAALESYSFSPQCSKELELFKQKFLEELKKIPHNPPPALRSASTTTSSPQIIGKHGANCAAFFPKNFSQKLWIEKCALFSIYLTLNFSVFTNISERCPFPCIYLNMKITLPNLI